ncbi:MAG: peptide-methionine (R)-S-oxide reductase, partial [Henriciella sp.]
FDSGTGWPSFYKPIRETAIDTKTDFKMILPRKECHCATCGLHMGHVFKDGPPPTGERWCINGVVLNFKPA